MYLPFAPSGFSLFFMIIGCFKLRLAQAVTCLDDFFSYWNAGTLLSFVSLHRKPLQQYPILKKRMVNPVTATVSKLIQTEKKKQAYVVTCM